MVKRLKTQRKKRQPQVLMTGDQWRAVREGLGIPNVRKFAGMVGIADVTARQLENGKRNAGPRVVKALNAELYRLGRPELIVHMTEIDDTIPDALRAKRPVGLPAAADRSHEEILIAQAIASNERARALIIGTIVPLQGGGAGTRLRSRESAAVEKLFDQLNKALEALREYYATKRSRA